MQRLKRIQNTTISVHIRLEIQAINMEKRTLASKISSSMYVHDATSSRFLDSFQGMFRPANADVPFAERRAILDDRLGSDKQTRVRLLYDELLSSAKNNSFQVGSQQRTQEGKSPRALAYKGGNYGGPQDLKLSSPFYVFTKSTDLSSPAKIKNFAGEIAAFESAAQAVSNKDTRENNFKTTLGEHYEKREESKDEPAEKRRKLEDSSEDDDANNGTRERKSYWERRRKNNASAKKSRDARKAREMETQIKAAFLERENLRILAQLMIVQQENACLKRVLCAKM
ncbi:uncharacterized protein LOC144630102 [Oculina patagonica]